MRACVRACVHACVRARARARVCVCVCECVSDKSSGYAGRSLVGHDQKQGATNVCVDTDSRASPGGRRQLDLHVDTVRSSLTSPVSGGDVTLFRDVG